MKAILHLSIAVEIVMVGCCGCSGQSTPGAMDAGADAAQIVIALSDAARSCLGGLDSASVADGGAVDPLCTTTMASVSFGKDVAPILIGCTGEICHAAWRYDTLVGPKSTACCDHRWLITPGQPSASHVVQALTGVSACVPRMPLDGERLPDPSIATLIAWVCQGALDN